MRARNRTRAGLFSLTLLLTVSCAVAQETATHSDADARIAFYQARLGDGRGAYPAYARLGAAYLQKGRETGRTSYYEQALEALSVSLRSQRNFEALLWMSNTQLARHRFRAALDYAQEAVAAMPEHLSAHGALFDAHLALGEVQRAKAVVEQMLSMQAGPESYTRLAALAQYRGDLAGAVQAMQSACAASHEATAPAETRAWCEVRLGSLHLLHHCAADQAEAGYRRALEALPDYHVALEHLAELRAAQGRYDEAFELYESVLKATGDVTYRVTLANIHEERGQHEAAERERSRALSELRRQAQSGSFTHLRLLALLLLERKETAAEGLRWAREDWEHRRDVLAADSLAWAHYQNGDTTGALEAIEQALQSGSKDAAVLLHAATIYAASDQPSRAREVLGAASACPLALGRADWQEAEELLANLE